MRNQNDKTFLTITALAAGLYTCYDFTWLGVGVTIAAVFFRLVYMLVKPIPSRRLKHFAEVDGTELEKMKSETIDTTYEEIKTT